MPGLDGVSRSKQVVNEHFERILVVALMISLVVIHWYIDDKLAFLNFYYLPVIVAGFHLGRRGATLTAVLIVSLVGFFEAVVGLGGGAESGGSALLTLLPWAGFLILTGYVVGGLADQRRQRLTEAKEAYLTVLELLTFHIESSERQARGHAYRVSARANGIAQQLRLDENSIEALRVAALLHELRPDEPGISRLFEQFPGGPRALPVVASMRSALDIVSEYSRYHELVGDAWPADHVRIQLGTKILAVADAFETLQLPGMTRPPMSVWGALEEIERGRGTIFATDVVLALRRSVTPERSSDVPVLVAV